MIPLCGELLIGSIKGRLLQVEGWPAVGRGRSSSDSSNGGAGEHLADERHQLGLVTALQGDIDRIDRFRSCGIGHLTVLPGDTYILCYSEV